MGLKILRKLELKEKMFFDFLAFLWVFFQGINLLLITSD